jgi:quinol monooxygenase YgiN
VIVVRFRFECRPELTEEVSASLEAVVAASRAVEGLVSIDIGRDVTNGNAFIATEVYDDRAALDRQMELPEVVHALALIRDAATERESIVYDVTDGPGGD